MARVYKVFFLMVSILIFQSGLSAVDFPKEEGEGRVIHVLSIDGGGMRGVLPAQVLIEMEEMLANPMRLASPMRLGECFDLIAGTSTGGILALGLSAKDPETGRPKYTAKKLKEIYEKHGKSIFPERQRKRVVKSLFQEKYDAKPLEAIAQDYFENLTLRDTVTPVMVTTYDATKERLYLFDSEKSRVSEHDNFYLKDVVRATSAAPTYFNAAEFSDVSGNIRYKTVDGGVVCNNPALRAYFRAKELYPKAEGYTILSIGTGFCPRLNVSGKLHARGQLSWAQQIPNLMMSGMSQEVEDTLSRYQEDPSLSLRYHRIQTHLSAEESEMDLTDEEIVRRWIALGKTMYEKNEGVIEGILKESLSEDLRVLKKHMYGSPDKADKRFPEFRRNQQDETELDLGQLGIEKAEDARRILEYFVQVKREDYVLQKLYLTQNGLLSLEDHTQSIFPQRLVEHLYKLQLDQNSLEVLPSGLFTNMRGLTTLNLSHNNLKHLSVEVFEPLSELRILYLNSNSLEELPEEIFAQQRKLVELRMDKNKFIRIPEGVFQSLRSLKRMDLGFNSLRELHQEQFKGLSLERIDLRGNCFQREDGTNSLRVELFQQGHPETSVLVDFQKVASERTPIGQTPIVLPEYFA